MKISRAYPPNYREIVARIPAVKSRRGIIFTYGHTIYCPGGNTNLPAHLIAHEETHAREQDRIGIQEWWDQYLTDVSFRLDQELLAYQKQYSVLANRAERKKVLPAIVKDLSGAMYGNIIDPAEAKRLIVEGA